MMPLPGPTIIKNPLIISELLKTGVGLELLYFSSCHSYTNQLQQHGLRNCELCQGPYGYLLLRLPIKPYCACANY